MDGIDARLTRARAIVATETGVDSSNLSDRLTVLITNIAFSFRSGTEIVVDQIARGLNQRGHRPIVFST
jgi:hypothetical protein